jgi:hypothetical protein
LPTHLKFILDKNLELLTENKIDLQIWSIVKILRTYIKLFFSKFYKNCITHKQQIPLLLPNNVGDITVPNILLDLRYNRHLHWLVFLFHSKLQILAQTRYPLRKINTVCRQS